MWILTLKLLELEKNSGQEQVNGIVSLGVFGLRQGETWTSH